MKRIAIFNVILAVIAWMVAVLAVAVDGVKCHHWLIPFWTSHVIWMYYKYVIKEQNDGR